VKITREQFEAIREIITKAYTEHLSGDEDRLSLSDKAATEAKEWITKNYMEH
jgi:hypothetical protein